MKASFSEGGQLIGFAKHFQDQTFELHLITTESHDLF